MWRSSLRSLSALSTRAATRQHPALLASQASRSLASPTTTLLSASSSRTGGARYISNGDVSGYKSQVCAVLGAQWGDEGKGKLVDILAGHYDIIARFNGGANAGHTLVVDGKKFAFHLLPCGMLHEGKVNIIGNGIVLDLPTLFTELDSLTEAGIDYTGRLKISDRAHLLFDAHKILDGQQEAALGDANIGTTKRGIGPCYSSKATREGLRVCDLYDDRSMFEQKFRTLIAKMQQRQAFEYDVDGELAAYKQYAERIRPMVIDTQHYLNTALAAGKTVLAEGANAAMLDIDHGTYPFVTSSAVTAGGICTGLGLAPTRLDSTLGVVKAYLTRVGSGPFPTELFDADGEHMAKVGHEFGTTTGRARRCGWLDAPMLRYSHALNNYQGLNITKLDVLTGLSTLKIGTHYVVDGKRLPEGLMPASLEQLARCEMEYETMPGWTEDISKCRSADELPFNARAYLQRITELVGVPVSWVGVSPARDGMVKQLH